MHLILNNYTRRHDVCLISINIQFNATTIIFLHLSKAVSHRSFSRSSSSFDVKEISAYWRSWESWRRCFHGVNRLSKVLITDQSGEFSLQFLMFFHNKSQSSMNDCHMKIIFTNENWSVDCRWTDLISNVSSSRISKLTHLFIVHRVKMRFILWKYSLPILSCPL